MKHLLYCFLSGCIGATLTFLLICFIPELEDFFKKNTKK